MDYERWRQEIFGQSPDSDPFDLDLQQEVISLPYEETFDFIDRALADPKIHEHYSKEQIGIGLYFLYNNGCGDFCFCYREIGDNDRKVVGIKNLKKLYGNYFERYCSPRLTRIGGSEEDSRIERMCYMFWDTFILYPRGVTSEMTDAVLEVLETALGSQNESCIVSAIHGLGHWVYGAPRAEIILDHWLESTRINNELIIQYAHAAKTGRIQ